VGVFVPHNDEFLRLLQAVERGRVCDGKPCLVINDSDVARAEESAALRSSHLPATDLPGHESLSCPTCREIKSKEIALREALHAQGVDFPLGILET